MTQEGRSPILCSLEPMDPARLIATRIVACRGATNERTTEGLVCGGPLRAARAEEGNPRPGLS